MLSSEEKQWTFKFLLFKQSFLLTAQSRPFTYSFKVRVTEMLVHDDNRDLADVSSERLLLEVLQPFQWHNGGAVRLCYVSSP